MSPKGNNGLPAEDNREGFGRPDEYNETIGAAICESLRNGNGRKASVAATGFAYTTFLRWLERHETFATNIARAEAEAEAAMVKSIKTAATGGDWRAAAFWLSRRSKDDWGDKPDPTSGDGGAKVVFVMPSNGRDAADND